MTNYEHIEKLALNFKSNKSNKVYTEIHNFLKPRFAIYVKRYFSVLDIVERDIAVSNTLVDIWEKIHMYDHKKAKFSTWAYTILKNNSLMLVRKNKFVVPMYDNDRSEIFSVEPEEDIYLQEEQYNKDIELVKNVLQTLTPLRKRVMELHFFEGLDYDTIAKQEQIPLHTVKNAIHIGLTALREKVASTEPSRAFKVRNLSAEHKKKLSYLHKHTPRNYGTNIDIEEC
jgi:RNA polymerase sigma-70 factor (ECF subfamily)